MEKLEIIFFPMITMPQKTTLLEIIAEAKFHSVNNHITDKNFPLISIGKVANVVLLRGNMTSCLAIDNIKQLGYIPAITQVIIGLKSVSNIQEYCPIIGPGSVWIDAEGKERVPAVWGDNTRINLYLDWFFMKHTCYFAGFQEQ